MRSHDINGLFMKTLTLTAFLTVLTSSALFAQDGGTRPEPGMLQPIMMIAIAMAFFYFILWRPEQKRRKALEEQRSSLKKGDKVTVMGIIGHIDRDQGDTVILKMIDGNKIEVLKGAITDVVSASESENQKE
ncbi:putative preprotein translocase subunit YajC [Waddlia chondrophila WSU 86-1044]|uniref:Sec translocon accessory complex subunit YajC n=2 Tax=Waddlia chondrophila TaxID=71667 RepID=D6YTX0_WADCW|nr:putative preprotein translocase subunit YajC [Waddlia chondrophila WSU 86-1044]